MKKQLFLVGALVLIVMSVARKANAQWEVTGNSGTNPTTNYLGTSDVKGLSIRTAGDERIRVTSAGNIGIGISSPAYKLDIDGDLNTNTYYRIDGSVVLFCDGLNNTLVGKISNSSLTGLNNTAVGRGALSNTTSGTQNTAIGVYSLQENTTGSDNTAVGYTALRDNETGVFNTALGKGALLQNISGSFNTASGWGSLEFNDDGNLNTAYGYYSLLTNNSGSRNVAIGAKTLYHNEGYSNCAFGFSSLFSNTSGNYNAALGDSTLYYNETGSYNAAVGSNALYTCASGNHNVATGYSSLYFTTTGYRNTASGSYSMYSNTTGYRNTASGYYSLFNNTSGHSNTSTGWETGSKTSGNTFCSFFGYDADNSSSSNYSNSTAIGKESRISASNQVRIGNSSITSIGGSQDWSNISDGRYKKEIKENVKGLAFINKLRPVTYHLDVTGLNNYLDAHDEDVEAIKQKESELQTGFIAQEVEEAAKSTGYDFSGVDKPKNEKDLYGLRYATFVVPLVKAVQELDKMNEELKIQNEELKSSISSQKTEIELIKSVLSPEQQQRLKKIKLKDDNSDENSGEFLEQNYPNPFTEKTIIKYNIPNSAQKAVIKIYSEDGMEMNSYLISTKGHGQIEIKGGQLAAGSYLYSLITNDKVLSEKRMVLTK